MNIDQFLNENSGKPVVVVQGLGFVGSVMSLVVANALSEEYAVIGVDIPNHAGKQKVEDLNNGIFPIETSDKKVLSFFQNARKKGNFLATTDVKAYEKADVVIVDINLDVQKESNSDNELLSFDVNLSPFESAIRVIAKHCKEEVLVLVETTVPPGTCQHLVQPIFEEEFNNRKLEHRFCLGHSYERVMPGPGYIDSIQNFYRVYSGIDERSAEAVEHFLRTVIRTDEYPLTRLGSTNATEIAKVLENSFRAMNIAFIEEWGEFAEEAGVNLYEVVSAIKMRPTHTSIMRPGLGVGGYCLTKDPLLASWARQNFFKSEKPLTQSEMAVRINDQMPKHCINILKEEFGNSIKDKKIIFLGVSYLNDVGDTRSTPVELLFNSLEATGATILLHDPYIKIWEEKERDVESDIEKVLNSEWDICILSTAHSVYMEDNIVTKSLASKTGKFFLDTWGVIGDGELSKISENNQVRVVGRGDF